MLKKSILLVFLGLVMTLSGLNADDERERAWDVKMEQVRQRLLEKGESNDLVEKAIRNMTEKHEKMADEEQELAADSRHEGLGLEGGANTFYGYLAGSAITSGTGNSFFGRTAGKSNTSGMYNTIIGHKAGFNITSGWGSTFIGYLSGYKNTGNMFNTYVGYMTGYSNSNGDQNTFVGFYTGCYNTTGWGNTFLGAWTGAANTNGNSNTFIGDGSGFTNETGARNTFLGRNTGHDNVGSGNVFLGNEAGLYEMGSDKLFIDNSNTATPLIFGDFSTNRVGINNSTPGYMLVVGTGGARCNGTQWIDGSSRNFKENVEELAPDEALQAIAGLVPVKFNYKEDKGEKCLGFIAEEVPELVAMNDRNGLSPMDIVAALTKVVQEQQKELKELRKEIALIKSQSEK